MNAEELIEYLKQFGKKPVYLADMTYPTVPLHEDNITDEGDRLVIG